MAMHGLPFSVMNFGDSRNVLLLYNIALALV
jgi:hypothetical protein